MNEIPPVERVRLATASQSSRLEAQRVLSEAFLRMMGGIGAASPGLG